jgi:hypothetical protein
MNSNLSRDEILELAADYGYNAESFADLLEQVERHIASPDNSLDLNLASQSIRESILSDVKGDLAMWIHEMAPEDCPCNQCVHMRADIGRIQDKHAEGL